MQSILAESFADVIARGKLFFFLPKKEEMNLWVDVLRVCFWRIKIGVICAFSHLK